jgi:hypothetical protein
MGTNLSRIEKMEGENKWQVIILLEPAPFSPLPEMKMGIERDGEICEEAAYKSLRPDIKQSQNTYLLADCMHILQRRVPRCGVLTACCCIGTRAAVEAQMLSSQTSLSEALASNHSKSSIGNWKC